MRSWIYSYLAALAIVAIAPGVSAQEETKVYPECTREPTEGDVAAAKGAFQAGQASFNEADYPRAIVYWEDAFRRDCTAAPLLLNLARAYELDGQKRQAVVALETFLERKPDAQGRDQITRRIEVLNRQIEEDEQAAAPPPPNPAPEQADPVPAPPPDTTPPDSGSGEGRPFPVGPVVLAGAGATVAIAGAVLFVGANSKISEIEEICPERRCMTGDAEEDASLQEEGNSARTRQNIGGGLLIGGGVMIGGSVVWYLLTRPKSGSAALEPLPVEPQVGPGYAGLNWSAAF